MNRHIGRRLALWAVIAVAVLSCMGAWNAKKRAAELRRYKVEQKLEAFRSAAEMALFRDDPSELDRQLSFNLARPEQLRAWLNRVVGQWQTKSVAVLLKHGSDPNGDYPTGTPLRVAAATGNREAVEMLLKYGADVNRTADGFNSALLCAVYWNQVKIARILLDAGAMLDDRELIYGPDPGAHKHRCPIDGKGPSDRAYIGGPNYERHPSKKLVSPIMLAAWLDEPEMVRMLLEFKPSLTAKTRERETALDLAKQEGNVEVIKILQDAQRKRL
jgi:hypothetical protein